MLSGAFWINKPAELTSSDVVVRLKIALTRNGYCEKGFKIGHGGTLDPFATGALVILVGEATKLADAYLHSIKSYGGIIQLGIQTDTGDFTGSPLTPPAPFLCSPSHIHTSTDWQKIADTFVNEEYWQTPPMYSAKKIEGRTLHSMARQGIEVERKAILKKIDEFKVHPHPESKTENHQDLLSFHVRCESGTYVRVIAEDLAKKAGTLAHLKTLVRTQTSDVTLEKCSDLEVVLAELGLKKEIGEIAAFHPMKEVASHLPSVEVNLTEAKLILQGHKNTVHSLIQRFYSNTISGTRILPAKYFVARLNEGSIGAPVALFEHLSENDPLLQAKYRLQRVILWE